MNIDVSKIVEEKINSLAAEKVVEKAIEDTFEKAVVKAVTDALDGYSLQRMLKDKVEEQVSKAAEDMDFQTYNGFMVEKFMQIINETCREDLCQKAEKKFKDIFLCQTKEISLMSIFEKYREIACNDVDEPDKYDRADEGWHCKCEENEEYGWIDCELDCKDKYHRYRSDCAISFSVHRDKKDSTKGKIGILWLDGVNANDKLKLGSMNDVELLLVQAVMNDIPINIDVEFTDDIDNSFDVDY